jgi:hypothetical protein
MTMLREQLEYPDMMPFILPSLVAIIEHSSNDDYRKLVQPEFRKVINGARPVQVIWHFYFGAVWLQINCENWVTVHHKAFFPIRKCS